MQSIYTDTVYIVLCRLGTEWDGQSIMTTKSKALFDYIKHSNCDNSIPTFDEFSEELKADLIAKHALTKLEYPDQDDLIFDDITLSDAIEWLEERQVQYPVTLGGETELNFTWNW